MKLHSEELMEEAKRVIAVWLAHYHDRTVSCEKLEKIMARSLFDVYNKGVDDAILTFKKTKKVG